MERGGMPTNMVGNDFFVPRPRMQTATPVASPEPTVRLSVFSDFTPLNYELAAIPSTKKSWSFGKVLDFAHKYSVGTFAVLFLMVGTTGTHVAANYYTNSAQASVPTTQIKRSTQPLAGFNMSISTPQLQSKVQTITSQPINITMGGTNHTIKPGTIQSWLNIVDDNAKGVSYIHVSEKAVQAHLQKLATSTSKAPRNQVSVTHNGVSKVIVGGVNGIKVNDTSGSAKTIARNLFSAKGFNEIIPTENVAFQATTPAAFPKMIEVDLTTKQMYLYENGTLYKQYAISAGAPETPTPVGQYKTNWKLAKQDMRGYNPDGSRYFQPNVKWISYFAPDGIAIHGNYWRPASWFGRINSSHGCVSLPDHQAKEVYNWTPTGTTVITHL